MDDGLHCHNTHYGFLSPPLVLNYGFIPLSSTVKDLLLKKKEKWVRLDWFWNHIIFNQQGIYIMQSNPHSCFYKWLRMIKDFPLKELERERKDLLGSI